MDSRLRSPARSALGAAVVFFGVLCCVVPAEAGIFGRRWNYAPAQVIAPATAQRPRQEQVVDLPEDGDSWHLTIIVDGSATAEQLVRAFESTPRLADLSGKVKLHWYSPDHWWAKQYFPEEPKPLIYLSDQTGARIYKASGNNLPASGEELADEIESSMWARSDCGPNCPQPTPETRPQLFNKPAPKIADERPAPGMAGDWQVGAVLVAGALVIGLLIRRFSS